MIEKLKINSNKVISSPSQHVLFCLDNLKRSTKKAINICEIGVGIGATTIEIANRLDYNDILFLFDFQYKLDDLYKDLKEHSVKCHIKLHGNSTKMHDSYAWSLAKLMIKNCNEPIFDLLYLDGAHEFLHDAPSTCLIKEMLKINSFFILDDVYWTYKNSPSVNPEKKPEIRNYFTEEQICTPHIDLIIKCLLDNDHRFQYMNTYFNLSKNRAVFKKIC